MRSARPTLTRPARRLRLRRALLAAAEVGAWALALGLLEALGRTLPAGDVVDLAVLVCAGAPLAWLAVSGVKRGRLPLTARWARGAVRWARRRVKRLDPGYHLALRPPAGGVLPDQPLRGLLLGLGATVALAVLAGPRLLEALDLLRAQAYTPYLLLLTLLWSAALGLVALSLLLQAQVVPLPLLATLWLLGLVAAALLPAGALLGAVLALGLAQALRLRRRRLPPYLFCRRDAAGRVRALPAQAYLRRLHLGCVLAVACVVALTNAQRLLGSALDAGPHGLTSGLGTLAALGGLLLVLQVDLQFGRLLHVRSTPPEEPLTPTLWWGGPGEAPPDVLEAAAEGWAVQEGPPPDPDEVDLLVVPGASGPRLLARTPHLPPAERAFRRLRRFHVVHRRELVRRLRSLVKSVRHERQGGTGFLLAPHLWLVPSLLRDGPRGTRPVGRPYHAVFAPRTRRYVGGLLRALQVDVVYWEDGVTWPDLRRVLGVAFECFDQGRTPVRERHFLGLPRVRVLLHEEAGDAAPAAGVPRSLRGPVATGARVLVILRDRGGTRDEAREQAPSDRLPAPLAR